MTNGEQTIANLKKLKSFHNGSYGTDIDRAIKALEQEPCEDCVSRQFMLNLGATCIATRDEKGKLVALGAIEELPPVTPIRPKGHWICDGKGRSFADYHCSKCGLKLALCGQDIKQRQDSGYSLFCGGCGADMREVEA